MVLWLCNLLPSLPEVHICAGCVELWLLRDRVRELELQFEAIRLVRENEEVIDRRYRQVVTPGPHEEGKWFTVRKGKSQVVESTPVVLPLKNKDHRTIENYSSETDLLALLVCAEPFCA